MESHAETREVYTVEEAAARLGIGRALAYRLARANRLPVIRLGGRIVVPKSRLDRLLDPAEPGPDGGGGGE